MTDQDRLDGAAARREEPALDAAALERAESEAAAEAAAAGAALVEAAGPGEPSVLTSADYTVAFSPRQVAVGLAIVAGLVALVVRRRRRRTPRGDG